MNERIFTSSGYTLLELVLVLAVLAVALAAVAPTLSGFGQGRKAEETAARFVAVTRWARTQAISDGCNYRIVLEPDAARWTVQVESGDGYEDIHGPLGRSYSAPEGVTMESDAPLEEDQQIIYFEPSGRSDVATVTFTGSRGSVTVVCDAPIDEYHILREEVEP